MSILDLYADGFPHGTREGYERGCRSNGGCPNKAEGLQTCAQADLRLKADWEYQKLVNGGMTELGAAAELGGPAAPHKLHSEVEPVPVKKTPLPVEPRPMPKQAFSPAQEDAAESVAAPKRMGRPPKPLVHGTDTGWRKGCKVDEDCPEYADGRKSCRQAHREHLTGKAAAATPATVPATVEPVQPDLAVADEADLALMEAQRVEIERLRDQVAKSYRWYLYQSDGLWVLTLRNEHRVDVGIIADFIYRDSALKYIADHSGTGVS